MDFTREPIIETVITPRDGFKLAIRNSKGVSQEEFFVDAIEIVSFGGSFFYRSLERPKSFMVPVTDYEILEVRETRMVLKHVGIDRAIKIGGGKEKVKEEEKVKEPEESVVPVEPRGKRERRRHLRRRRGEKDKKGKEKLSPQDEEEGFALEEAEMDQPKLDPTPEASEVKERPKLIQPPPKLISENIERYRDSEDFKGAFIEAEGKEASEKKDERFPGEEEVVSQEPEVSAQKRVDAGEVESAGQDAQPVENDSKV